MQDLSLTHWFLTGSIKIKFLDVFQAQKTLVQNILSFITYQLSLPKAQDTTYLATEQEVVWTVKNAVTGGHRHL